MNHKELKDLVREKYGLIAANTKLDVIKGCCGTDDCCSTLEFSMIGDEYLHVEGYNADADLGLGCGLPTQYAGIEKGHSVLDLGCGAGNDCFVARSIVGSTGKVTGLDFSQEMLARANKNLQKFDYTNVEFIQGDIEEIPLHDEAIDVVISNCVLNLVPDKKKAYAEIHRVLKKGGHFCISDVVVLNKLPEKLQQVAELYAGCISGAIIKQDYLDIVEQQGFLNIEVKKEKAIVIPHDVLTKHLNDIEIEDFKQQGNVIYSITIFAQK